MRRTNDDEQNFARIGTLRSGGRTGQRSNRMRISLTGSRRNRPVACGWAIRGGGCGPAVSGNASGQHEVRVAGSGLPEQSAGVRRKCLHGTALQFPEFRHDLHG